jgi:hypothetical protein
MADSKNGCWIMAGRRPISLVFFERGNNPVEDGTLYSWNLSNVPNGISALRLTLIGDKMKWKTHHPVTWLAYSHRAARHADSIHKSPTNTHSQQQYQ